MSLEYETARTRPTSIRSLLEAPKLALDRAPVLREVFERLAGACGEGMRALCVPPCAFTLNAVTVGSTSDLITDYQNGMCGVCACPSWDARILIGLDRRFISCVTDAIFGGDGTERPSDRDRPYSMLEVRAMKHVLEMTAVALASSLVEIDKISVTLERVETCRDMSSTGVGDAPAVMAQLIARVCDSDGRLFVIVPQSALAPFRKELERERLAEPHEPDPIWTQRLLAQVGRADVRLDAVLDGPCLTLNAIAELSERQILRLPATSETLLSLESMGQPLFRCKLGQSNGSFTVRIEQRVDPRMEVLGEIVAGTHQP